MKMKSVSIPIELHTWLYKNITTERKSLYAVIEWLRDCKEHSDRVGDGSKEEALRTRATVFRFVGDKPKLSEFVEVVPGTNKVRITHDMSKAIGFRLFDPVTREPDQVLISFDVIDAKGLI